MVERERLDAIAGDRPMAVALQAPAAAYVRAAASPGVWRAVVVWTDPAFGWLNESS
jgi:hypothetical protein